tara:strand:+ start:26 stop:781 length:756 start_codon:yes stop_codon:yes gene_type:complete
MFEVIFLSVIQGITEFLPISSSAHLILVAKYFSFNNENLTLDISLHLGSLIAIIIYFRNDLFNFLHNKKLFYKIIVSSIPVIISGFLLVKLNLFDYLRNYKVIGWTTLVFGVLLYFSDLIKVKKNINRDFNFRIAFFIGFFQILSLMPGVSRSGITITAARFFNFNREESAKISFLISIPTLAAVSFYNLNSLFLEKDFEISLLNLLCVVLSFIFSYLTIKYFLKFLKKFSLLSFVIYRVFLGLIIIIYAY